MATLSELEKQQAELLKQQEQIQKQIEAAKKAEEDKKLEENTRKYQNRIFQINNSNSMKVYLSSSTKTTPLMDEFYHSKDKEFLVLKRIFLSYIYDKKHWLSLVIAKHPNNIRWIKTQITMTNLKGQVNSRLDDDALLTYDDEREYPLIEAITDISKEKYLSQTIIPFEYPVNLNAQIKSNQTGYGSEYHYDELVYQGTLYGETTDFAIIGIIKE